MGTLDEIKKMKGRGMSQEQIIKTLRERKIPYKDISDALAQSDIKAAVEHPGEDSSLPMQPMPPPMDDFAQQNMQVGEQIDAPMFSEDGKNQMPQMDRGMQPSQMYAPEPQENWEAPMPSDAYGQQEASSPQTFPVPSDQAPSQGMSGYESSYGEYPQASDQYPQQAEQYGQEEYPSQEYGAYPAMSSDAITEVAEQVVAQKLSDIRKPLEKVISMKTNMDSQIENIEERLKHIEKIMHTLQTSVLGKVGEFMTNVQDIKKEMIETQKTFAKATQAKRKAPSKKHHTKK